MSGEQEKMNWFGPLIGLDQKEEDRLEGIFDNIVTGNTPFDGEITFSSPDGLNVTKVNFQELYESIDVSNFGKKSSNNKIELNYAFYKVAWGGVLAKLIQHRALCESGTIQKMEQDALKEFCDGKIGPLSLIEIDKGCETQEVRTTIGGEITTMGVVLDEDKSEFSYELGESEWNTEEAKKFAKAVVGGDQLGRLAEDMYGERGEHVFGISFYVDMTPVVKESTKKTIEREYALYSAIAENILSDENRSYLEAVTVGWKGGYDSEYNAKLGYNRAMNAIVSTYLIGTVLPAGTAFAVNLEKASTLEEVVKIFDQAGDSLPNYSFTIYGDGFGQSKSWGKRGSLSRYQGQYDRDETEKSNGRVHFHTNKFGGGSYYYDYDPRTNSGGRGTEKKPTEPLSQLGDNSYTGMEKYKDGSYRRFDDQGNYIYKY